MCRSIRPLFNFDPPTTEAEIEAAALQYVRKVSGMVKPSGVNVEAFDAAVRAVAEQTAVLLAALTTNAAPKDREVEAEKARVRAQARYGG